MSYGPNCIHGRFTASQCGKCEADARAHEKCPAERDALRTQVAALERKEQEWKEGVRLLWVEGVECLGRPDRCDKLAPCAVCVLKALREGDGSGAPSSLPEPTAALRARVRTLEGALASTLEPLPYDPDTAQWSEPGDDELRQKFVAAFKKREAETRAALMADDSGAQLDTALAEREASIVELRRALELLARVHERPRMQPPECSCALCERARAALAQPAPQAALRAMLVKVAQRAQQNAHGRMAPGGDSGVKFYTAEEVADAVLKGES